MASRQAMITQLNSDSAISECAGQSGSSKLWWKTMADLPVLTTGSYSWSYVPDAERSQPAATAPERQDNLVVPCYCLLLFPRQSERFSEAFPIWDVALHLLFPN